MIPTPKEATIILGLAAGILFGMFHVVQSAELRVSAGAGGSYPYDGAKVSGSPALKAKALVQPWKFLAFGIGVSQQLNYIAEAPGTNPGAPGGPSSPSQPYAGGSYHPHGNTYNDSHDKTTVNNTTNNDSHDVTNIYLPQAQPPTSVPRPEDSRLSSTLSLEPELQLGYPLPLNCPKASFWPYIKGTYGADRHSMQDGRTIYGNSYSYGAGLNVVFGRRYFLNIDAANKASESSIAVFRSVEAGIQAGLRFGL